MIARVWNGVVPIDKADAYARYLADFGVRDYKSVPGNRGVSLLRRVEGDRVRFLFVSLWESRAAIEAYVGPDIEQARYYSYDLECVVEGASTLAHYEVIVPPE